MKCKFCEEYELIKATEERLKKVINYKIMLVEEYEREGQCCGTVRHKASELNYCPVCGRKYKEDDRK